MPPGAPFTNIDWHQIPALISNYIRYTMWDEITYSFPNFSGITAVLKCGNGYVVLSHTLLGMWLLIHARIKFEYKFYNHFQSMNTIYI